jgi:hypothetical protein
MILLSPKCLKLKKEIQCPRQGILLALVGMI